MIIETGKETHPTVEVTGIYLDIANGRLDFRWGEGAPFTGDCSVPFAVDSDGTYTAEDIKAAIIAGAFGE
jgi:hypothetical protein